MPSIVHETPMELIRQYPALVMDLVQTVSGLKLEGRVRTRLVATDASVVVPAQFLADGAVLAEDENGNPLLVIIIEPQGRDAHTKEYSWPVYLCSIRKQQKCDAVLLVICWDRDEVEECRRTIQTGHPGFDLTPIVAHPDNTLGDGAGEPGPYLLLFASYIGAIDLDTEDGQRIVLEAARQVPGTSRDTCVTLILAVASEAARRALEAKMATPAYRSDFIESFKAEGRAEGKAEGRAEGKAEGQVEVLVAAVIKALAARGIQLDKSRTEQVQSCTDRDRLNAWFESALTATTADDVFGPSKPG
jgi:hypothetical protein